MIPIVATFTCLLIVGAYGLLPALVYVRCWLWRRPWKMAEITPSVSVIIICHNEAASIENKLRNVLASDYPGDLLEVIVGTDGSDDGTDRIARSFADSQGSRVSLCVCARRGKIPALNDSVPLSTGEILVFSDANSQFRPDAIRKLTRHFADPTIGCVAGNQVYTRENDSGAAAAGERSYWSIDRRLKVAESASGNAISATGAIYAIRRELFQPVPSGVTDDFTISTRVIGQGYRLVFDPEAIAEEPVAGKPRAEFRRKFRVMTRGLRSVMVARPLFNPLRFGFYSLQLFLHKVLRRLVVLPLLALLGMTPWLWLEGGAFRYLAVTQWAFYSLAFAGWALSTSRVGRSRILTIPYFFCLVNLAALMALANVLAGRKIDLWEPQRNEIRSTRSASSAVGVPHG